MQFVIAVHVVAILVTSVLLVFFRSRGGFCKLPGHADDVSKAAEEAAEPADPEAGVAKEAEFDAPAGAADSPTLALQDHPAGQSAVVAMALPDETPKTLLQLCERPKTPSGCPPELDAHETYMRWAQPRSQAETWDSSGPDGFATAFAGAYVAGTKAQRARHRYPAGRVTPACAWDVPGNFGCPLERSRSSPSLQRPVSGRPSTAPVGSTGVEAMSSEFRPQSSQSSRGRAYSVGAGSAEDSGARWAEERLADLQGELVRVRRYDVPLRRRALRGLQRELHPDKQQPEMQKHAQLLFQLVQVEWEALEAAGRR